MLQHDVPKCHQADCSAQPALVWQRKASHKRKRCSLAAAAGARQEIQKATTLPASKLAGRSTYQPASFDEMVTDASNACVEAIKAGLSQLEVEFPPLPSSVDSEPNDDALLLFVLP